MKKQEVIEDYSLYHKYDNAFRYSLGLVGILFFRIIGMIIAEFSRIKSFSFIKTIKYNMQVMIFIGRFIFNLIIIIPFFFIGSLLELITDLYFWLPIVILGLEELPGLFLSLYIYMAKNKTQDETSKKAMEDLENQLKMDGKITIQ